MYILAMDILEMDISEMTSSKGIGIQICPFPICPFYDEPPFLPDPDNFRQVDRCAQKRKKFRFQSQAL
jgi:hypothetical protein